MGRQKNADWDVTGQDGVTRSWDQAHAAILMDIRDELQTLNRVFACSNFLAIPQVLREIQKNTKKRKRPRRKL